MAWYDPDPVVRRRATFTVGAVVGAVILGCVWLVTAMMNEQGEDALGPSPANAVLGTQSAAPRKAPLRTVQDRCEHVFSAQAAPLRAAIPSMDGWEVHVEAMNQLVAGEITLDQASDFWNQTRRQAAGRLAQYDDAVAEFRERGVRCISTQNASAETTSTRACVSAVAARDVTLRRAAAALSTWREHVHHMEMLRQGQMSPADAVTLWQLSWRAGVRQIDAYRAASQEALGQEC